MDNCALCGLPLVETPIVFVSNGCPDDNRSPEDGSGYKPLMRDLIEAEVQSQWDYPTCADCAAIMVRPLADCWLAQRKCDLNPDWNDDPKAFQLYQHWFRRLLPTLTRTQMAPQVLDGTSSTVASVAGPTDAVAERLDKVEERLKQLALEIENFARLTCPVCGNTMTLRSGQYGPFYGCNSYKDGCRGTRNADGSTKLLRSNNSRNGPWKGQR